MPPILLRLLANDAWAIQEGVIDRVLAGLSQRTSALASILNTEAPTNDVTPDGVAIIPVSGMLVSHGAADIRWWGEDATGYDEIRAAITAANADARVTSIELAIDSPGGAVTGIHETGDAINASKKPITARVQSMAASAAYWLAAQTDSISAPPRAQIGSIGVYNVAADISGMLAKNGIDLKLISSGGIKGHGADGKVSDQLKAEIQKRVDLYAADFVEAVASGRTTAGRGTSTQEAQQWATGHVWFAAEAQQMGLIDQVETSANRLQKVATMSALALVAKHPKHAELIATMAIAGDDVAKIESAIMAATAKAESEAKAAEFAAQIEAAKAATAKVEADAQTWKEMAHTEKARADKATADLAALKDLAKAGAQGAKLKPDGDEATESKTITRAEYEANPAQYAKGLSDKSIKIA